MWHEARKQEKKIRGLMVDLKKRADRRREFYEKIKLDPTQFLRVHGVGLKVHVDVAIATAAEGPQSMMPWQGNKDNMIDRFDVRANLDLIPENKQPIIKLNSTEAGEERLSNYERYRTLVQNECAGLTEEQSLHQIYIDEQFGDISKHSSKEDKKKLEGTKAAIAYTYEEPGDASYNNYNQKNQKKIEEQPESSEESDVDVDLDVAFDVDALTEKQAALLNSCATEYGMGSTDYIGLMKKDKADVEEFRRAKILEEEKAQFSGRKSRRERRAYKEKRQTGRPISPPSYAARASPTYDTYRRSSSRSRSPSPVDNGGSVMFISSFGEDDKSVPILGPTMPANVKKSRRSKSSSSSSSRSRSRGRDSSDTDSSSLSRSRSRSRGHSRRRSSSSRSRSRSRSKSRSRHPSPPIKRYRRPSLSSNSDLSDEDNKKLLSASSNSQNKVPASSKIVTNLTSQTQKLTPRERMKRKMQVALNRQYKKDKVAAAEKQERSIQEQLDREEELRVRTHDIRRRDHRYEDEEPKYRRRSRSRSRERRPRSRSRDRDRYPDQYRRRSRSRSRNRHHYGNGR